MPKLIKWTQDYSDEFDMSGFFTKTDEEFSALMNKVDKIVYPIEAYFGTNEFFTFKSPKEVKEGMVVTDISDKEYKVLDKLFGPKIAYFGWTPFDEVHDSWLDICNKD